MACLMSTEWSSEVDPGMLELPLIVRLVMILLILHFVEAAS